MSNELTVLRVIGTRPADVPADWLIFNAPRPLYGKEYTGDFKHGIFYAAIDPADDHAAQFIYENQRNDGWLIQYIDQGVVDAWATKYAKENDFDLAEFDRCDILDSFALYNGRVIVPYVAKMSAAELLVEVPEVQA